MTALAYSILGPASRAILGDSTPSRTGQGLVLTHLPGTPLVLLWPSLTPPQCAAVKAELGRLLARMRSRRFSYYGRPMQHLYILFSAYGIEKFICYASRSEWGDSRVHAMQKNAPDAERAVDLERLQRGDLTGADDWDRPVLTHGDLSDSDILVDPDTLAVTGILD
ncbi:hypothetical protein BM221_006738 [Beauveria bassiana]|uniref:Aminoglycoside phosphotransferase domain-containing protein n=1 Tax=Beauveria bassiana TaxID=176275 RepID=A0A2N6NIN9_BEABA|nr:hypothetical protein BM221_006738 [Beauveria bassiana]